MSEWISVDVARPNGDMVIWYHPAEHGRNAKPEYFRIDRCDLPFRPASHWTTLPKAPEPPK